MPRISTLTHSTRNFGSSTVSRPIPVECMIIGGGGAGSSGDGPDADTGQGGGGGGAGGLIYVTLFLKRNTRYGFSIGGGGLATGPYNYKGSDSTFASLTALAGGTPGIEADRNGGSGAGGTGNGGVGGLGTAGQGNNGGNGGGNFNGGGGGGGANAVGFPASGSNGGPGGNGRQIDITGVNTYYAGGGGGGVYGSGSVPVGGLGGGGNGGGITGGVDYFPTVGQANTGGGGGGGFGAGITEFQTGGASGGSGVLIIAYPSQFTDIRYFSPGTVYTKLTSRPGYKVYRITGGAGEIIF